MFDLKGFRKDRRLSQKQISEILGIGTSFISQIETGKDPMPSYIPDKLADAYGKEEIEKYYRESSYAAIEAEKMLRKKYLFAAGRSYMPARKLDENGQPIEGEQPVYGKVDAEWIERVLKAIERRDELAFQQQREYERQGERIDDLLAILKAQG